MDVWIQLTEMERNEVAEHLGDRLKHYRRMHKEAAQDPARPESAAHYLERAERLEALIKKIEEGEEA